MEGTSSGSPRQPTAADNAMLDTLFNPRVVAVIGASADPAKWGHHYAASLLKGRERRRVYLVNSSGKTILGEQTFTRCADLPATPDLAVICVPVARSEDA